MNKNITNIFEKKNFDIFIKYNSKKKNYEIDKLKMKNIIDKTQLLFYFFFLG